MLHSTYGKGRHGSTSDEATYRSCRIQKGTKWKDCRAFATKETYVLM